MRGGVDRTERETAVPTASRVITHAVRSPLRTAFAAPAGGARTGRPTIAIRATLLITVAALAWSATAAADSRNRARKRGHSSRIACTPRAVRIASGAASTSRYTVRLPPERLKKRKTPTSQIRRNRTARAVLPCGSCRDWLKAA